MSQTNPADAPIMTAIELLRLSDRNRGFMQGVEVVMLGWEADRAARNELMRIMRVNEGKLGWKDLAEYIRKSFESDLDVMEKEVPRRTESLAKFITLLQSLGFKVDEELADLKEIRRKYDGIVQGMNARLVGSKTLKGKAGYAQFNRNYDESMKELVELAEMLGDLMRGVDTRVNDALVMVARMTSSVASKELIDLFTKEP